MISPLRAQDIPAPQFDLKLKLPEPTAAKKPKSDKWVFSLLPVGLQRNPQVDYAIITELTDAGRKLPPPSFADPVYYISHSLGQRDVGDAYGGTKEIKYQFLEKQLNNALTSNGYRPASDEHPATQLLFITWGMHNKIEDSIDDSESGDPGGEDGETATVSFGPDMSAQQNLLSRAKTVGGQKFAEEYAQALSEGKFAMRRFAERDETTETLVYAVQNECYYLLVTALDIEALRHNEKKILWTTKISTISQGVSFEMTLPIMITNVAYYLGREMPGPEIVAKRAYRKGTVELGDMTVVDYVTGTSGTATTTPSGTTPPPPPAPAPR